MAVQHGYGKIAGTDALVFAYDTGDTRNSYRGEPTVNYVPGTYGYSVYAYVSGPVDTTVLNESNKSITAKRYTITQAINTARAAIFPIGLTAGVAYTFSFKWKYNGTTTASPGISVSAAKGNPEGGANNNGFTSQTSGTVSIGNGWYLSTYTFVFSSVPTGKCILTFGINTGSTAGFVGETFDVYEAQFEIKNHKTQYSSGTRSATQGLLDLTGNSSIDLTNLDGYNANAEIDFDGTNDKIRVPHNSSVNITGSEVTFEQVIKKDTNGNFTPLHKELQYTFRITSANQIQYSDSSGWSYSGFGGHNMGIVSGNYFHMVTVKKDGVVTIYVNNLVVISKSWGSSITSTTNDLFIGSYAGDSNFMDGVFSVSVDYNGTVTTSTLFVSIVPPTPI